ncbi:hypothetical protein [Pandoraea terrae]|uniref:hypothetical protein n=1 Tax=Pandoraea terrae TaxID=1537710 RepID=UPI001242B0DD|nr:hypothetical protein [Pandoraea terrae]
MQCPACGSTNVPEAARCAACGAALPAADAVPDSPRAGRSGEPAWLTGSLIVGTAVLAAAALIGIWWNLRAPYVDPVPVARGPAVAPFTTAAPVPPPMAASADTAAATPAAPVGADVVHRDADVLAAPNASLASAVATGASSAEAPIAASPPAPAPAQSAASDDDMVVRLSKRPGAAPGRPAGGASGDLPAHLNGDGDTLADVPGRTAAAAGANTANVPASGPAHAANAHSIAARLAQCERFRWYEVIPKQQCIWAICDGHWGKDGCPAGKPRTAPLDQH